MPRRSSSRTSSAAAFCSRRRRSPPASRIRGGSCRRGSSAARWRLPGRWPTRSWRRCVRAPAASTSTCERRSAAGGVSHWVDVVHRRLLGRDRGELRWCSPSYVGRFIPAADDATPLLRRAVAVRAAHVLASRRDGALRRSRLMTWIHVRGVGPGRLVSNMLAGLKVSALAHVHRPGLHASVTDRREPVAGRRARSPAAPGCWR